MQVTGAASMRRVYHPEQSVLEVAERILPSAAATQHWHRYLPAEGSQSTNIDRLASGATPPQTSLRRYLPSISDPTPRCRRVSGNDSRG